VPLSRNLGTLISWNPLGHSRPVTGLLYLLIGSEFKDKVKHNPVNAIKAHGVLIGQIHSFLTSALDGGGSGPHISRQSTHEGSKFVSSTHRQPSHAQEIFLVHICVRC